MTTVLVGHVTKDGAIAGPRTLEHLVDVVLHFEGDRHSQLRMVRAVKNRYGPTDEIGCFDLGEYGLIGLPDPSCLFLSQRSEPVPGTCVTVALEGRRALLAEVQALVGYTQAEIPRRVTSGPRRRPAGHARRRAEAPDRAEAERAGGLRGHGRRGPAHRARRGPGGRAGHREHQRRPERPGRRGGHRRGRAGRRDTQGAGPDPAGGGGAAARLPARHRAGRVGRAAAVARTARIRARQASRWRSGRSRTSATAIAVALGECPRPGARGRR